MKLIVAAVMFLTACTHQTNDKRIQALEKQVKELKLQLSDLDARLMLEESSPNWD